MYSKYMLLIVVFIMISQTACTLKSKITLSKAAPIKVENWGEINGQKIHLWTLSNENGLILKASNYGATLTSLYLPNSEGVLEDVLLGFEALSSYQADHPYMGGIVGRYSNRINHGKFAIDGQEYFIPLNHGQHVLHSGPRAFDQAVWDSEATMTNQGPKITFTRISPDGEQGFPGNLDVAVSYTLTNQNELRTQIKARTDQATYVSLIQHAYWNLGGHNSGTILDHEVQIYADHCTEVTDEFISTGELTALAGTPADFKTAKTIGTDIDYYDGKDGRPLGYDHNYVILGDPHSLRKVATVRHPPSGRTMTLSSNQPGLQFYTGSYLDGSLLGKDQHAYEAYAGFNMETQAYPNSPNIPHFPSTILRPGEEYNHIMVSKFGISK